MYSSTIVVGRVERWKGRGRREGGGKREGGKGTQATLH